MEKIKNLSLRKTLILYMGITLVCCFFLSAIIVSAATVGQKNIWLQYTEYEAPIYADVPRPSNHIMTSQDIFSSEMCDLLITWTNLFIPMIGCVLSMFLFYRNKIKPPLLILTDASEMIGNNQLDFSIDYPVYDEMGKLCYEFENMRNQLQLNNKEMWEMVEREKALRAAIAHDIRTPLTVLQGYQEMLLEFIPQGALDKEKVIEILESSMGQVERLNQFIDTMKSLSKLEDIQIKMQEIDINKFMEQMSMLLKTLCSISNLTWKIKDNFTAKNFTGDFAVIMEVCENLLSNAVRYAKQKIEVELIQKDNTLYVKVYDDGSGFADTPEKVTKAYYHLNPTNDLEHFGLGLYICKLYCEKHEGKLILGNIENGGAYVNASFGINKNVCDT